MRVPFTLPAVDRDVDVVALGENSLDVVAVVGRARAVSGKQRLDDFRLEPGGQMATAAVGCARLGLRTRYIGVFGVDEWSRRTRAPLDAAGVDVVAFERPGTPGRIAVILVDAAGERTVLERRHAGLVLAPEAITSDMVGTSRVLLADATQPLATLQALALARQAGTISVSDVDQVSPEAEAILAAVDVAVVPGPFVTSWAGTTDLRAGLDRLAAHCRHASLVIATCGADGSLAWCRKGSCRPRVCRSRWSTRPVPATPSGPGLSRRWCIWALRPAWLTCCGSPMPPALSTAGPLARRVVCRRSMR